MVHFYVNRIKHIPQKPTTCIDCGGLNLKDDAVLATMGPSQRDADYVPSVLCLSCETLMIITSNPGAVIGVNHSAGNQATMRNQ
ncbi:MAG: hypothetical protein NZ747_00730 [Nitrosopumilus sp.]|nr:hypothetical protein [Nitrosopumilus sp.]